jgi:CrcB protein
VTRRAAVAIAVGGAVGAVIRWGVIEAVDPVTGFPWLVFALNVTGSFALGMALARSRRTGAVVWWRDAVGIGFCGGLTTFSTFAVESAELVRDGRPGLAAAYVLTSVVAAMVAVWAGAAAGGLPRAVDDPLEAAP